MKNVKRNENANKGFSLVELIVVVAIMAVLMGVLAPQYLRYVEKTRLQKDNSAVGEIVNAIKLAAADEKINEQIVAAGSTGITIAAASRTKGTAQTITFGTGGLQTELAAAIGTTFSTKSNSYRDADQNKELSINVKIDGGQTIVAVTNWIDTPNGTPSATAKTDF